MRTLGIDLAAQDANTALCAVEWDEDGVDVAPPVVGVDDAALLEAIASADATGIDAPFGWPDPFVAAVAEFHARGRWPDGVESPALAYRLTDTLARELTGRRPLSVSSDRIAVPAWRCARLLTAAYGDAPVERHGGRIVEAYPGGALTCWGFDRSGYKGAGGTAPRAALVDALERASGGWLRLGERARYACVATDHALDALLCAFVARAAATGRTHAPRPEDVDRARREGWIEFPVDSSYGGLPQPL